MELERLSLKKEELPILYETCFEIPIHPKLLDENININESIAKKVFPKVAEEWYEDLTKYIETENLKKEKKEHIKQIYLKEKPKITRQFNRQFVNEIWEDNIQTDDNGFVTCFSINRNAGGSLYFNRDEFNCQSFGIHYIKFSDKKKKEFQFEKNKIYVYAQHNIDYYSGALFLRNWAILYMNEIFKEVF